ncbi:hypothetical protein HS125_19975 [bacterium]|nr:hypothetical protein [bacterium]
MMPAGDGWSLPALSPEDMEYLRELGPLLEGHAARIVDGFVDEIARQEAGQAILKGPKTREWFKQNQRQYLLSLTRGCTDRNYLVGWRQEGGTLEWLGLSPRWYLSAYAYYYATLVELVVADLSSDPAHCGRVLAALHRRMVLDLRLMIDAFAARGPSHRVESLEQQMEKMAAVGQLATGLAHEIGTPLNVISGNAEYLLMDLPPDSPMVEELSVIVRETKRVSMLMSQLLKFARPAPPSMDLVDLSALISEVLSLLMQEMAKNHVELVTQMETLPPILGDANQLKQVLVNMILNAIHAMPGGGRLEISARAARDALVLSISDTGHGIAPEHLPRIFDPFFTTKDVGKGTGLGLSVCYRIVNEHKGRIEVDSRVGEGTTFKVVLPREDLHEHEVTA